MRILLFFLSICYLFDLTAQQHSIRFFGYGYDDTDRVKIPLVTGITSLPVNVSHDFTVEFWIKSEEGTNLLGAGVATGNNDDWTLGHIIVDRDIFGPGNFGDYGISLANGRIAFGVNNGSSSYTLLGFGDIRDGMWHHVAVTRSFSSGQLRIFVDGAINATGTGPTGNISYNPSRSLTNSCGEGSDPCVNEPYIVLGAEKHDYDPMTYPSFDGWMDELRISDVIRYSSNFTPLASEFSPDANTVALFHFNEGSGTYIGNSAGTPDGTLFPHPNSNNDHWSSDSPFQSLSTASLQWTYEIIREHTIFKWMDENHGGLLFSIDLFNEEIEGFQSIPEKPYEIDTFNNNIHIKYHKPQIPEGYYRISWSKEGINWIKGEVKKINYPHEDNIFVLFPNPALNFLNIQSVKEIKEWMINDDQGRLISIGKITGTSHGFEIPISQLNPGIYFIKIVLRSGDSFVKKFVRK
jgi:hypothetical protein